MKIMKKMMCVFISALILCTGSVTCIAYAEDANNNTTTLTEEQQNTTAEAQNVEEESQSTLETPLMLGPEAQKLVPYLVPEFIDAEHPEKGIKEWTEATCSDYKVVTDSGDKVECTEGGWYVVTGNITAKNCTLGAEGATINIILCDGASLTIEGGDGTVTVGKVNFYGQTNGTGKFTSEAKRNYKDNEGIGSRENTAAAELNFYGGQITARGVYEGAGIGFAKKGKHSDAINIYGGTITASCNEFMDDGGPGISASADPDGEGVKIYGGKVTATGAYKGPGIGVARSDAYNIKIYGGNVKANGGDAGAGIGGGDHKSAYNIEIYGDDTVVTATAGGDAAGIGGGHCGSGSDIVIAGGTVTASASGLAAGIGGGYEGDGKNITISGGTVKTKGRDAGIGGKNVENITISGGTVEATATEYGAGIGTFYADKGTARNIRISGGDITATGSDKASGIGAAHKGTADGIYISGGTIKAYGGKEGAGIGAAYQGTVKNIEISQATDNMPTIVTANGGSDAAGIGGGKNSSVSDIKISGGTVTATGGSKGAGIGGGYEGDGTNITISGGTVTATGGIEAAGIGGSYKHKGENITISGGNVTAKGGESAAGIGGGKEGIGNLITISGGVVEAAGGAEQGAGIGGGDHGASDNIVISGGRVKVTEVNNGSPGIGGGRGAACGNVTISGGYIEAKGGYWGPAIGAGANCTSGSCNIKISNAALYCHKVAGGGYPAIGIGPWPNSNVTCSITVSGENTKIWNMDTNAEINNNGGNLSGTLGDSSILITNGTIVAKGATMKPVTYSDSVSTAGKERIEQLMNNILMTTSGIYDPAVIHFLIECIGIDSILFATDYPYEEFAEQYNFIKNMDLTDEQKEQIFHGNADRFIFKKPEAIEKYGPRLNYQKPVSDEEAEKIALSMTGTSNMDEVCAEINRIPHAYIPNLLRANVSLRQVAIMKKCSRWSLKKYFCVNV